MTHSISGDGRGPRGHFQRLTSTRTSWLVMAGLVLAILALPSAARAELIWQELWTDDFEHSMNEPWILETYGPGDRIDVVPEGYLGKHQGPGRCPPNNVLYGESLDRKAGHGFAARTPSFSELGIDESMEAYRVDFRYMVVDSDFCWTLPLASPDLTLVVTDCSADRQWARLGVVDANFRNFRPIASIEVGVWHEFSVQVRKLSIREERVVRVFIDGTLVQRLRSAERNSYEGIVFMDLPALPVDATAPEGLPDAAPSYFGSGYWDDVSLRVLRPSELPGAKDLREVTVDPNPFNPATTIRMQLDAPGSLDVVVYDLRGREVRTLYSDMHPAGPVELRWNGRDLHGREVSSGVYLVRVNAPGVVRVVRAVLVR